MGVSTTLGNRSAFFFFFKGEGTIGRSTKNLNPSVVRLCHIFHRLVSSDSAKARYRHILSIQKCRLGRTWDPTTLKLVSQCLYARCETTTLACYAAYKHQPRPSSANHRNPGYRSQRKACMSELTWLVGKLDVSEQNTKPCRYSLPSEEKANNSTAICFVFALFFVAHPRHLLNRGVRNYRIPRLPKSMTTASSATAATLKHVRPHRNNATSSFWQRGAFPSTHTS
ncbi:hypothetical protein LZ32DRAFT_338453 [Colletotrichum eremochloae]|nr:hypothetical protein LZ32DRAFT_338453 [Colletotrichum eremochloae]